MQKYLGNVSEKKNARIPETTQKLVELFLEEILKKYLRKNRSVPEEILDSLKLIIQQSLEKSLRILMTTFVRKFPMEFLYDFYTKP